MEELLKSDFLSVVNAVRRSGAPEWTTEPLEFNYGQIKRFGFRAFETSKVVLG